MRQARLARIHRVFPLSMVLLTPFAFAGTTHNASRTKSALPASADLGYLTRLSGPGTEQAWDIAVDRAGNAYIAGLTDSTSFAGLGQDPVLNSDFDAFVVKLRPDGTIVYARRIGGSALDQASKIAVDVAGNAYIAGYTYSSDFPTTPGAFDRTFNGGGIDAFVAKLSRDGQQLVYSTYLGGSSDDYGGGITVDSGGHVIFTGYSESSDFPTTPGAFDRTRNGPTDAVVVGVDPSGSFLTYSTFLGGSGIEIGYDIAVDDAGSALLTGQTMSIDFPTTAGSHSPLYNGGLADAFVVKVAAGGGSLDYSTYLGGSDFDDAKGIVLEGAGNVLITGRTDSGDFPTTPGAFDRTYNGGRDVFVTQLSSTGAALGYSTYVGGSGEDEGGGIALGAGAFVTGWTLSDDFPTTANAFDPSFNGNYDIFVLTLDAAGSQLDYSTYLGRGLSDYGRGIGTDAGANAYVAGYTGLQNINAFGLKLATQ